MKAVSVVFVLALVVAGTFCSAPRLLSTLATSDLAYSSKIFFTPLLIALNEAAGPFMLLKRVCVGATLWPRF